MQAYFRCCHLRLGSARRLERVKSDPKGEDARLSNEGGGGGEEGAQPHPPPPHQPPSNTRTKFSIQRSPMKNACPAGSEKPRGERGGG